MNSTSHSPRRISRHLSVIAIVLASLPAVAWSADLDIDSASWDDGRNLLTVRGSGQSGQTVTVANAYDLNQTVATTGVSRSSWRTRTRQLNPVPCRVRVTQTGGQSAEADVQNAPANCAPSAPGGNQAPIANAGPDQTLTLAVGQTTVAVTLDGGASTDPDGNVTRYIWSGNPNPTDVTSPTINLDVGSHTFSLVVTDNDGASSTADAVTIMVNPAPNQAPIANAGPDQTLTLAAGQTTVNVTLNGGASTDPDGNVTAYTWNGTPNPNDVTSPSVNLAAGSYTFSLVVTDDNGASSATDTVVVTVNEALAAACDPANLELSINSTSQDGCPDAAVPQQAQVPNTNYSVLAINDLGMHCGDLDTRIASILPPFQVLLAQVVQKGGTPTLNPANVTVYYSAVANPNDPILSSEVFDGVLENGDTYKTNFWNGVNQGTYDPFYPGGLGITPLGSGGFPVTADVGLPVPNVEDLYIGADGVVNSGDESLTAVQHTMSGISAPYAANAPQEAKEHYVDKPFFVNFPFGYVAKDVNWFEGAGVPFAAFDDNGRENAYPLVRVQAKNGDTVLSTVDTVLPISGEASCTNCHADPADVQNSRSSAPTDALLAAGLRVVTSMDDPDDTMPHRVSVEYAADINTLRLHDLKHGANYVAPAADGVATADPCKIGVVEGVDYGENGTDSCLTNQALVQDKPVVCQVCHYTPALDLAHVGPMTGPAGSNANGRNQLAHKSNSNVMHSHHGQFASLFPPIPAPDQDPSTGTINNHNERLTALEQNCYQCHPGKNTQCLRGAMFNGGMVCSDCHGSMQQVGADFSADVSPSNPGAFVLDQGNFYDPNSAQPRTPWANEPGCGSCHTGDAVSSLAGAPGTVTNTVDTNGNDDGIRLRQAFKTGDAKATPIVPGNKRFAEPEVPADFNGFANPGAGNPQLYRVSTGHGGVMCEGCHGATHAEWPNANPNANDNVTSKQLQGHTGTISDCATCHVTSQLPSNTQGGPHGMHLVNDSRFWREAHKDAAKQQNGRPGGGTCGACHGSDHLGTVLSRATEDRSFNVESRARTVVAGEPVGCGLCHSVSKSFGR
ncbi:MAG: PKD domain-containing protein [Chromatiaceae bacterium]|nr:PKD domain-containing protein [Chromatiaceae bacterium]